MISLVAERVEARTIGVVSTALSTLQVLTKLARLDPRHALRVPTRARCVVPTTLNADGFLADFPHFAVGIHKTTTDLLNLKKSTGKTAAKSQMI